MSQYAQPIVEVINYADDFAIILLLFEDWCKLWQLFVLFGVEAREDSRSISELRLPPHPV